MAFDIVIWIIFGAIAGWVGSLLMRTHENKQEIITNTFIGATGALTAGALMYLVGGASLTDGNLSGILIAIGASIAIVAMIKSVRSGNRAVK